MAQPIQTINIAAPGFAGLNTQDSPVNMPAVFAAVANNCVIDKYGRVGARKGWTLSTTETNANLGSSVGVEVLKEFVNDAGVTKMFSAANNKILVGIETLVDVTPVGYTITANKWHMVNFNNHMYFFQRGYEPLVYSGATDAVTAMSDVAFAAGTPPQAGAALAAFGRLWCADFTADKVTVYWSDLLNGSDWIGGSSGSIDLTNVWPSGHDSIVGMDAHNNFLVIFGKHSIIIYSGADTPSTMELVDSINGIGCVSKDSIVHTGNDILFLDYTGVRGLGRTIQEKSAPLGDVSKNVRDDLKDLIITSTETIKCHYNPEEAFYLVSFIDSSLIYCFDTRRPLEDGSYRATTWNQAALCYERAVNGKLYFGTSEGIGVYEGYADNGASYIMSYFSHPQVFESPANLKFLKKVSLVTIGGPQAEGVLNWGYDYGLVYSKQSFNFQGSTNPAIYNISEYNEGAEYSYPIIVNKPTFNTSGSGIAVTVGLEATINNFAFSLQEINIYALLGRIV